MESYKVKIEGIKPLLMHNPQGLISNKPSLRRGEYLDPQIEAESYLYKDKQGTVCIPSPIIKACLRSAGHNYKVRGRGVTFASMIRAALLIIPADVPLVSEDGWYSDVRPVVIRRNRILRARPRFDNWALEFTIQNNDPTIIHEDTLGKILEDAGKYYGLGDFRPEFGLFKVIVFEKQ